MKTISNLSKNNNCTIITTIHQPSSEIFKLFNKIVLMSSGRLIYFGDTISIIPYFTSNELSYCFENNNNNNPAEFILDIACENIKPLLLQENDLPLSPYQLQQKYKESIYYCNVVEPIEGSDDSCLNNNSNNANNNNNQYSQLTQFKMLLHRGWTIQARDVLSFVLLVIRNIVIGTFTGVIFFGQGIIVVILILRVTVFVIIQVMRLNHFLLMVN